MKRLLFRPKTQPFPANHGPISRMPLFCVPTPVPGMMDRDKEREKKDMQPPPVEGSA